ncbi:CDP-archaeol synthase [Candidatus Woesearchaeota archaeon]|nr:CDP-archaeol synthase [Candidatus Woesearchaeota archaeon]
MEEAVKVAYLLIPAYFANMSPVFFKNVNFLNFPVDLGKKLNGKPIFGKNKSVRGIFFASIVGIVVAFIQYLLNFESLHLVDYSYFYIIGFLLGFGALLGDLVESFFKRRLNLKPGSPFIPFDQIDYLLGGAVLISIFYSVPFFPLIVVLVFAIPIHIVVNFISYKLKLRDTAI